MTRLQDLGEFNFIDSINDNVIHDPSTVRVGIGDDCAVLRPQAHMETLVSTDTMVEGVHFDFSYMSGYDVGYRLCAANISDIAAMGGIPRHILVNVASSGHTASELLQDIYRGMTSLCQKHKVNLVGGDTVHTEGPMVLTLTVLGESPSGHACLRSGAQVGDLIFVTHDLGLAQTGLEVLLREQAIEAGAQAIHDEGAAENGNLSSIHGETPSMNDREGAQLLVKYPEACRTHKRPEPQVALGQALAAIPVHSLNDISDGLSSELMEIAKASQVSMEIEEALIPLHEETKRWAQTQGKRPSHYALYGGEDFQLVGTAGPEARSQLEALEGVHIIGRVVDKTDRSSVLLETLEGTLESIQARGYNHFKGDES